MNELLKREVISLSPLEDLQQTLANTPRPLSPKELSNLFKQHNYSLQDLMPWVTFDEDSYCRNRILLAEHAELLIMCWRSGQLSPIHNHKGSACCIRVISGQATEIAYEPSNCGRLAPSGISRFREGQVFASFDEDTHQMGNLEASGHDLITMHCYSPPLRAMELFSAEDTFFGNYQDQYLSATARIAAAAK